jgi:hypothetical protein
MKRPSAILFLIGATHFIGWFCRHFQAQSALHLMALPYAQNC